MAKVKNVENRASDQTQNLQLEAGQYYTIAEIALILRVSKDTIRRQIKSGIIFSYQIGRQYRIPADPILQKSTPKMENTDFDKILKESRR